MFKDFPPSIYNSGGYPCLDWEFQKGTANISLVGDTLEYSVLMALPNADIMAKLRDQEIKELTKEDIVSSKPFYEYQQVLFIRK